MDCVCRQVATTNTMKCYRFIGVFVLWRVIEASGRISNLPAVIPSQRTRHYRHVVASSRRALWGIRGGSDEERNDENTENEAIVMTTEDGDEASSFDAAEEDVSVSVDPPVEEDTESVFVEEEEEEEAIDGEPELVTEESILSEEETQEETVTQVDEESITAAREQAQHLRQEGKEMHDEGDWQEAATKFHQASLLLESLIGQDEDLLQEYATCRLHEALCRLKKQDYEASVEACSAVLEREPPAAIRARALHRRSRAKLGLGLEEEALLDARQAAFLGDRKAVALYGKLMRQNSGGSESSLQDLLQGGGSNPFLSSGDAPPSSSSSALLESLLNKSGDSGGGPPSGAGPMGMFMNTGSNNNNNGGGLAKSVLSSLSKTVDNESTQENICRYLQNTNVGQVQQMAGMAGVPLSESHASRIVNFCHGVTPKGIRKSLKTTRRLWYVVSLLRKVSQIISKYRFVFILWALTIWIKSAIRRPIPINKRAARLAMKQGLQQGAV